MEAAAAPPSAAAPAGDAPPPRGTGPTGDAAPAPTAAVPPAATPAGARRTRRPAGARRRDRLRGVAPREALGERIGRVDAQAGELTGLIREGLALPGIVAAAIAGAVSAGIVLAAGLLIALITPDASIVGAPGIDAGIVTEAFRQAVGTLLTAMVEEPGLLVSGTRRIHPLLLVAIPLGALILTTRWQLYRTAAATPMARLGWAALVALPFALLMLVFAVIGGDSDTTSIATPPASAFALGLLWGALGGLIGAATKLPLAAITLPRAARRPAGAALAALRPLAAVLVICTALGLVGWLIQVARDVDGVRAGRSAPTALIEEAAFAGEHGIHLTALAAGARFTSDANGALGLPFPVADANDVPGGDGGFRIFSYDDALPAYVLLPAIVVLMGLLALGALYGGFAAARAAGAGSLQSGALWGAITGPAWAIAMAILLVGAGGLFHGDADDGSVFAIFLVGGALLGAAGGALAVSGQARSADAVSSS